MRRAAFLLAALLSGAGVSHAAAPPPDKSGVTPQTVSLPTGPGSLEGLGASFQPALNTGSARYAVGVPLPAGTAGHTPPLALRYDSGRGDGPLGIGWAFGPGPVSRQVDKGVPRYVDGPNGIDDDADGAIDEPGEEDRFVGPDGEELVETAPGVYRARVEGRFARYRRTGAGWEVDLPDGTLLAFGATSAGRVTDAAAARVYRWLLERSTDADGNVIEYDWTALPGSTNQRYLREIRYGAGAPPWSVFRFAAFTWEGRPGSVRDCRGGFPVETAHRLARIDAGIQGAAGAAGAPGDFNADGTPDALVMRYLLAYDETPLGFSLLARVTRYGADGVNYLPPLSFTYAVASPPATVSAAGAVVGSENAPAAVMDSDLVDLVDLDRDGLPDLLRTDLAGGAHTAYLNRGVAPGPPAAVRWGEGEPVASADGLAPLLHLAADLVHLADMDGDGLADLVQTTAAGEVRFFPNGGDVSWGARREMGLDGTSPPAPFTSGDVTTADLDFDKRMDTVMSTDAGYTVWFARDGGRYSDGVRTPGARDGDEVIRFASSGVHVADMNGDRLPDVVQVRPTGLVVATGLGHGLFENGVFVPVPGDELTDGAGGQVERARLADVNGDGLADLVVERAVTGEIWCWLTDTAGGLAPRITVTGIPPLFGGGTVLRWADLNGNGTDDVVWADSTADDRVRALDLGVLLGGSAHPNLLTGIDSGLGVRTAIEWRTTTDFAVAARDAGNPWTVTVPFPVPVVAAAATSTGLDLDGVPGVDVYRRDLIYRDGFYEDRERAFRGFAETTVVEPGDATAPDGVTVHGFFTGGPDGADNDGDGLVDEVSPLGHREEDALKGLAVSLRSENAAGDLFSADAHEWAVRTVATGADGTEVRLACRTRTERLVHEGAPSVQETIRTDFACDDFGNVTEERKYGALSLAGDEAFTFTEYVNDTDRWLIGLPRRILLTDDALSRVSESLSYYDGPAFEGLPLGQATRGRLTRRSGWVAGDTWVDVLRLARDAFGNVVESRDARGFRRAVAWDPVLRAFPVEERVEVGGGRPDLVMTAEYEPGQGTLSAAVDFNGNRTEYGYDTFGRLTSIVRPGDDALLPTTAFSYTMTDPAAGFVYAYDAAGALTLAAGPAGPGSVATRAREFSGQPGTFDVIKYTDGLGRPLATVTEAETGFVVSRALRFDARGTAHLLFMPYAAPASDWAAPNPLLPATELFYDAAGREILRRNPPDALAAVTSRATAYESLVRRLTDEEGKERALLFDGLGRLRGLDAVNGVETYRTRYARDAAGKITAVTDPLDNVRTIAYDGLGRRTLLGDPDRGSVAYGYDAAGNLVSRTDARGLTAAYDYDGAGRLTAEHHPGGEGPDPVVALHYDDPAPDYPGAENLKGRLAWVEDAAGARFFAYDVRGRRLWTVRRIVDGGSSRDYRSARDWDALDRVTASVYPDGDAVAYTYNAGSLLESIPGIVDDIDYDPAGGVGRMAYASGVVTTWTRDPRARLTGIRTDPAVPGDPLQDLAYTLDGVGNLLAVADARPGVYGTPEDAAGAYLYDDLHRLADAEWPGHGAVAYAYDAIGNLVSKASPDAPDPQHIYDSLVNLGALSYGGAGGTGARGPRLPGDPPGPHAVTSAAGGSFAYAYDDSGNMTGRAGDTISWDVNDRAVGYQRGAAAVRFLYGYDGRRLLKEESLAGAVHTVRYVEEDYEVRDGTPLKSVFAGRRRVAQVQGRLAPGPDAGVQTIALLPGTNLVSLEVEPGDPAIGAVLAPVAAAVDEVWAFDAAGQTWSGFAPGAGILDLAEMHARRGYLVLANAPALLTVAGVKSTAAVGLLAGWNLAPCPTENAAPVPDAFAPAAAEVDAVWGYETAGGSWQAWVAAPPPGLNPLDTVLPGRAYWVLASAPASIPFAASPTKIYVYHPDHLGSAAVVTDDGAAVVARTEYYPYGRARYLFRAGFEPPYGFTGMEEDAETGLVALGARGLDPVTGRFTSVDPLLEDAYAYALNNPLARIDPTGKTSTKDINDMMGAPPPPDYEPGAESKSLAGDTKETGQKLADISLKDVANFLIKELASVIVKQIAQAVDSPFLGQLLQNLLESDILDLDYALNKAWGAIDSDIINKPILEQVGDLGGEGMKGFFSDAGSFLETAGGYAEGVLDTAGNALDLISTLPGGTYVSNPIAEKMQAVESEVTGAVRGPLEEVDRLADRVSRATQAPSGPNLFWDGNETAKLVSALSLFEGMDRFLPGVPGME